MMIDKSNSINTLSVKKFTDDNSCKNQMLAEMKKIKFEKDEEFEQQCGDELADIFRKIIKEKNIAYRRLALFNDLKEAFRTSAYNSRQGIDFYVDILSEVVDILDCHDVYFKD